MKLLSNRSACLRATRHPNRDYQLSSLFYCESAAVGGFSGYHRNPITSRKDDRARISRRCHRVVVLFRVIDVHMLSVSRSYAVGCSACVRATILRARIVNSIRSACDSARQNHHTLCRNLVSFRDTNRTCSRRLGLSEKIDVAKSWDRRRLSR